MSSWRFILSGLCLLPTLAPALAPTLPLGATVNGSDSTVAGVTFRVWAPSATSVGFPRLGVTEP